MSAEPTMVPVMRPRFPSLDAAAARLSTLCASGQFTNFGPQECELRERFAARFGVEAAQVATAANATLGLAGAVAVLGGRRWRVPTFTFVASPAAVVTAGAQLVAGDVRQDMTLADAHATVDGHLPVAPFGAAPDIARWSAAGRVVHDAAASLGNVMDLSALPASQAVVYSLHATKVLGSGEGAIVVFGDAAAGQAFRAWTNFGLVETRAAASRGVNAKMSEVQACFVHAALDMWDLEQAEWSEARELLRGMARSVGSPLLEIGNGINPYAIVKLPDERALRRAETVLGRHGVGTRRWWAAGWHRMPAYSSFAEGSFPFTDELAATTLGIPMYRGLTGRDVELVGRALAEALDAD